MHAMHVEYAAVLDEKAYSSNTNRKNTLICPMSRKSNKASPSTPDRGQGVATTRAAAKANGDGGASSKTSKARAKRSPKTGEKSATSKAKPKGNQGEAESQANQYVTALYKNHSRYVERFVRVVAADFIFILQSWSFTLFQLVPLS
jgi:hypothetical protein